VRKLGLGPKILIGIVIGVGCGLFFGEGAGILRPVGGVFVGLLQMTVLPYVMVSLVASLGRLSLREGKRLAGRAGLTLLALLPLSLPDWESASFFSTSMVESPEEVNPLGLYIPVNFFQSLTRNAVPAVVLFCICLGVALIGVPKKEALLDQLDVLSSSLMRVNVFVIRLTPYGVFAIAASTAGTMRPEELGRLQAYLILYTAAAVISRPSWRRAPRSGTGRSSGPTATPSSPRSPRGASSSCSPSWSRGPGGCSRSASSRTRRPGRRWRRSTPSPIRSPTWGG
jgi:Na+/H+-dicarboxylate symporter